MNKKKIGGVRPNVSQQVQQRRMDQNRQLALKADQKTSKASVSAKNLGSQGVKTDKDNETVKTQKESVTLSSVATPEANKAEEQDAAIEDVQDQASPSTANAESAAPKEKSTADFQTDFVNSFSEDVEPEEMKNIHRSAQKHAQELEGNGKSVPPKEVMLAATSFRHATANLKKLRPGLKLDEIRAQAGSDPEVAKNLKLLDSSSNYVAAHQADEAAAKVAAGGGQPVGAPPADGSQEATANPFDTMRGAAGQQGPPDGQPPVGGQEQFKLDPAQQAQMMNEQKIAMAQIMADNNSTRNKMMEIFNTMMAENRKASAQRMQIIMDTAISIRQMNMDTHVKSMQSFDRHNQKFMGAIMGSGLG